MTNYIVYWNIFFSGTIYLIVLVNGHTYHMKGKKKRKYVVGFVQWSVI